MSNLTGQISGMVVRGPGAPARSPERTAVTAFVNWIASNAAYNGADDEGQRFYDLCLNTWLTRQAARYLKEGR